MRARALLFNAFLAFDGVRVVFFRESIEQGFDIVGSVSDALLSGRVDVLVGLLTSVARDSIGKVGNVCALHIVVYFVHGLIVSLREFVFIRKGFQRFRQRS